MKYPAQFEANGRSIGEDIARGAAWVIGLRFSLRLLGLVSTLVLARLLTPADFGLIALASVIVSAAEVLGEFNFTAWLVRERAPGRVHYDTVWTLGLIRSLAVALLVACLAIPVSHFYQEPRLVNVLFLLAAITVLSSLQNVGLVDLQKYFQFDREFKLTATVRIGSFLVTVACALIWRSYWALIAGTATAAALRVWLSYRLLEYRPSLSLAATREILNYSKWLLSASLFAFVYLRSRTLILGKMLDTPALGTFSVGQQISNLAATELVAPLRRVLFPAYSKLQDDPEALVKVFAHTFAMILLLGLPIACGIGLVAEPLVTLALGPKWLQVAPIIQVLVFYGIGSICLATQGPLLMTLGHTRLLSNLYMIGAFLQVPALLFATDRFGLVGAASAVAAVHLLLFALTLTFTVRCTALSAAMLFSMVWRILISILAMVAAVVAVQSRLQALQVGDFIMLTSSVITGLAAYGVSISGLWFIGGRRPGAEATLIQLVINSLKHRRISLNGKKALLGADLDSAEDPPS